MNIYSANTGELTGPVSTEARWPRAFDMNRSMFVQLGGVPYTSERYGLLLNLSAPDSGALATRHQAAAAALEAHECIQRRIVGCSKTCHGTWVLTAKGAAIRALWIAQIHANRRESIQ